MKHIAKSFQLFIGKIKFDEYVSFFEMPFGLSKSDIKSWKDFAYLNFLGIESILNSMQRESEEDFDPEKFSFVTNNHVIAVKLAQYSSINFSNYKLQCSNSIMKIISSKSPKLFTIFLFMNHEYTYAFEYIKDYLTRPYEDNNIKMMLVIFFYVKGKYLHAQEMFQQVQEQFNKIKSPLKFVLIALASRFYRRKLGKHEEALALSQNLLSFYTSHAKTRKS